jgi:hypothetical protein
MSSASARAAAQVKEAADAHRLRRPSFLATLLGLRSTARAWRAADREITSALAAARQCLAHTHAQVRHLEVQLAEEEEVAKRLAATLTDRTRRLGDVEHQVADAVGRWESAVPAPGAGPDHRELSGPWTDSEWNAARTKVFLAALHLHQSFAAAEPTRLRQSLGGAMDVLKGGVPADAPGGCRAGGIAKPVLRRPGGLDDVRFIRSRLLPPRSRIARLVVHRRSGSGHPQAAAGAIWRSKRVVVVGDPKQIEPVVTIPLTAQQALRINAGIADWWLPDRTSADVRRIQRSPTAA